ncbi:poly-gamma-glutamate hydrolase family protein [Streptomyces lasalocidi]
MPPLQQPPPRSSITAHLPDTRAGQAGASSIGPESTRDSWTRPGPWNVNSPCTTITAMHGGGIEAGTSELCLAIAGYHPATLEPATETRGPVHDYWMFEGQRSADNRELHVTARHCDDHVALSMAASSLNVLSLHGCTAAQAGAPAGRPEAVVVGGRSTAFQRRLTEELTKAGFRTVDGAKLPDLNGDHVSNLCNRTVLGEGGQLELTTALRDSMFAVNTRPGRPKSTNDTSWAFVNACRAAVARLEAMPQQAIL